MDDFEVLPVGTEQSLKEEIKRLQAENEKLRAEIDRLQALHRLRDYGSWLGRTDDE
jgi:cell division protein FtsB